MKNEENNSHGVVPLCEIKKHNAESLVAQSLVTRASQRGVTSAKVKSAKVGKVS